MELSLGFSPCPNDTFIFDAMVHGRIDTEGLRFVPVLADVEELNRMAAEGRLQCTKLSFNAFAHVTQRYALLDSGSALGRGCGPLLISKRPLRDDELPMLRIAIPGQRTTANFLMAFAYPGAEDKVPMLFSRIEQAVVDGEADAGVIIHENRFTYAQRGLLCHADLGERWERATGHPIPLGGIAVLRSLPAEVRERIGRVLRRSVEYAFAHPGESMPYTRSHAQEMDEEVMRQHIALYVNDFSVSLGDEGRAAIQRMFSEGARLGLMPNIAIDPFD